MLSFYFILLIFGIGCVIGDLCDPQKCQDLCVSQNDYEIQSYCDTKFNFCRCYKILQEKVVYFNHMKLKNDFIKGYLIH